MKFPSLTPSHRQDPDDLDLKQDIEAQHVPAEVRPTNAMQKNDGFAKIFGTDNLSQNICASTFAPQTAHMVQLLLNFLFRTVASRRQHGSLARTFWTLSPKKGFW